MFSSFIQIKMIRIITDRNIHGRETRNIDAVYVPYDRLDL